MDQRWENVVKPVFSDIVQVLDPLALRDRLYSNDLVTREEFQRLSHLHTKEEMTRMLLVDILPRKGKTAYDRFLDALQKTKGQEHVVEEILRPTKKDSVQNDAQKIKDLEDRLANAEAALSKQKLTTAGLRIKLGPRWYREHVLKWEMMKLRERLPQLECNPYGCVAEINGAVHLGWGNKIYWLKNGKWKEKRLETSSPIGSLIECEGNGYVINGGGFFGDRCKTISVWNNETEDLELLTKIPPEYQLRHRSAVGQNGKIYFVGGFDGKKTNQVDCFDIHTKTWSEAKRTKQTRWASSLAAIDDKLFVGGGWGHSDAECFLIKEDRWVDIKPNTKEDCEWSSWNGKLVATGGHGSSNVVEMYDDSAGDWLPLPPMNKGRWEHGACATKENKLFVVGGDGADNSVEYLCM